MPRSLRLIPVQNLEADAQLAIRDLRNDEDIRRMMFSNHLIGLNEHMQWLSRLKTDRTQIVFGILDEARQKPLGVFSLAGLDSNNKVCNWGFYLAQNERGSGIGTAIEMQILDLVFGSLDSQKLDGTVVEGNDAVLRFYKRFGFQDEGFRFSEINRDGSRIGVHLLGLQRGSWIQNKPELIRRYRSLCENFSVAINWKVEAQSLTVIDQIEAARAKNNVNWMNILRIAVEKSPVHAKQIVAEIRELDQQIAALTAQIELEP